MSPYFECINTIRYAAKLYVRWGWNLTETERNRVFETEEYLSDTIWAELERTAVKLT